MKTIKRLSLLIIGSIVLLMKAHAQGIKNYEADWKQVETHINKGLPASALEVVKKIYTKAKTDGQDAQVVKALMYMNQLQTQNREDNEIKSIKEIETEIAKSKQPQTSLLYSYLAGVYQNYFNRNRYKLYNRTNTVNFVKDDPDTWTMDDYHKKISSLYLASIQNQQALQQTKLEAYDALITKGNVRYLRPTLYDLLAHRALVYFTNNERDITKPAYKFEINQPQAFAPADIFSNYKFETQDSLSLWHKALLIYQELLRFHLTDSKPDALIDADIARIEFVYQNAVHPEKETYYYQALENIVKKYPGNATAAQAKYLMALWHHNKALQLSQNKTPGNKEMLRAKELAESVMNEKAHSEGKVSATNLYYQIIQPQMNFQVEKVNVPDAPFRMLVNYKNFDKLYLRVIKATDQLKALINDNRGENKYWSTIANTTPLKTWQQPLPVIGDYLDHSTEIKVDALPVGEYFLLASVKPDFGRSSNILALTLTYISNISYVNNAKDFFVLHRNTGQPLANAKVQVWTKQYNYQTYAYTKTKLDAYNTDKNGYFSFAGYTSKSMAKNRNNNSYMFEVMHNNDKLFIDEDSYAYYHYNDYNTGEQKLNTSIFLFTDRSLYRPGQTIYFKGIAVNRQADGKKADILANYKTTITLYDANQQKVDSLQVSTNAFGSFNGSFKLPETGLNGVFTISTTKNTGTTMVRMEEYKRPKFYVDFEKIKGAYKLNEDVTVTGIAKAYAGNNIDGATVKYRVVREARFPYPWLFWRGWWPRSTPQEITHGEAKTDADGKFTVTFKAIPDLQLDPKLEPVFDYKIDADITDINGETRSGTELVSVGYKSLLLKVTLPERAEADSLKQIIVRTENMAGQFEKANATIAMYALKAEQRLLRPRYWEKPDTFVMSKQEYISYFPNDIYDDENDPKTWSKGNKVLEQSFTTDSTGNIALDKNNFAPGYYAIEITTKDKDGKEVKDIQYVELYNNNKKTPAYPQYLMVKNPTPIEPGEKTNIEIGTSASNVFLIQGITKTDAKYSFFELDQNTKPFDFAATEADRGGFGATYLFVKNNRVFSSNNTIIIPWSNKDLTVTYATFRDKTLPGSEEKWTVKIAGYKGEKLAAEMLAGMYDASLDQFYPHQWNKPSLWYNYYNRTNWNTNNNFQLISSILDYNYHYDYKSFDKQYDWIFDNQFNGGYLESVAFGAPGAAPEMARRSKAPLEGSVVNEMAQSSISANMDDARIGSLKEKKETSDLEVKEQPTATVSQSAETQIRKNFNETAFFFPDLKTDKDGSITLSFTMPEALTKWKFQALSHTKDLAFGYSQKEIVTQKDLMVQPNAPRFLREGDKLELSSKVVNLSGKEVTGIATLQLFDPATNEPVDGWFKNTIPQQYFTIAAGQSQAVNFPLEVPYQYNKALTWRIIAKLQDKSVANLSDGEENILPVLTNRMLVTETLPLALRSSVTKNFSFDKLKNSGNSETLSTQSLTVEYTSNPAWYAVQALPYMMQYPYECAEQTWNKYYANSLATMVANSAPNIKNIFDKWRTLDTAALMSNLQKNQELKAVLLEETPWVLQAQNESQQKKNIAVLFDLMRMAKELNSAYDKLKQMQSPNGGFVWFKGGPDDRYITQYIVTGIGHLQKLNAVEKSQSSKLNSIANAALPYLDLKIKQEYEDLKKYKTDLNKYAPSYYVVQYLYMRSFFKQQKIAAASQPAVDYFIKRAKATWVQQNKYMQGMVALALHRNADPATPAAILKSLKETSVNNEELGMYYKDAAHGWWWYEAPIERQALIIEAFEEIAKDKKTADDLRTWLLKNKQTNNWESTKATAEACYALLLQGTQWLEVAPVVNIQLGNTAINLADEKTEAGTGYFKKTIPGEKVNPAMGNISVTVKQPNPNSTLPTWGAVYWQYFENLDKISFAATPLKLSKKLFVETNSDRGPVLTPVNEGQSLKVGDKIKVRVELRVDRDMEYVHMKDMRASGFEPVNVLSSYKWQGGLGYYETTKDASTNFFFGYLPKGTYVFEYSLFATMSGNFSNGITTIQCMYAPEFTAHSEGVRVNIK